MFHVFLVQGQPNMRSTITGFTVGHVTQLSTPRHVLRGDRASAGLIELSPSGVLVPDPVLKTLELIVRLSP